MLKIIAFTVTTLISSLLHSQNKGNSISGSVVNSKGEPIAGANIIVKPNYKGIITDIDGNFKLNNLNKDKCILEITFFGYTPQSKKIDFNLKQQHSLIVILQESNNVLDEVVIRSKTKSEKIEEQSFSINSIDVKDSKGSTANVGQILNRSSGVRIRQSGGLGSDYNFSLNGLSDNRVRFFVDDIPIDYLGDAYKINSLPVNLIDRIDVYKGVVPTDFGADALGGAVNIVTNKSYNSFLDASYSYGSFNTHQVAINSQYRNDATGFTIKPKAFYNFSNNNYTMYNMDVYVDGKWETLDVERFNDNYSSFTGMIEGGYTHVDWADEFLIGYSGTKTEEDIQTDFYGNPIGEAHEEKNNHIATIKYAKKEFIKDQLSLKLFAVYNINNSVSIDTTSNRYNWSGEVMRIANDNTAELSGEKTIFSFEERVFIHRTNLEYKLNNKHSLGFNHVGYSVNRQGENRLGVPEEEPFRSPNTLSKNITGLNYNVDLFNDQLNFSTALKHYHFSILAIQSRLFKDYSTEMVDLKTNKSQLGYYATARCFFSPQMYLKGSYERGYRLPEPSEIFGDGLRIYANPELQPESSNNYNMGFTFKKFTGNHSISSELNLFVRDVDNYTFQESFLRGSQYVNILSVLIYGLETDIHYSWNDKLVVDMNMTRQYVLNNEKYVAGRDVENSVYRDQLPNTPYWFWNFLCNYKILKRKDKFDLAITYDLNYVHQFFLGYATTALRGQKNDIPKQVLHNVGISINSANKKYSLTLESTNVLNALAFDNYNIQKPGRAYFMKLRYFLN